MKRRSSRNEDVRHIRQRQRYFVLAAGVLGVAFVLLGAQSLIGRVISGEILFWAALASLFLAVAALALLAAAKCPRCGQAFIGNTVPESGGPVPELFTPVCRHCGHPHPAGSAIEGEGEPGRSVKEEAGDKPKAAPYVER